jgi:signal transduction histidine kinase
LRTATYAQIPPGRYRFEVSACNTDGAWNDTGAVLELTAEPYWWETAWFRVLGPLAAAGLLGWGILAGVRRRHRRQIERLEMLRATERERARIARDMHDEIGGSLTKIGKLAAGLPDPAIAETTREVVLAMDQVVWTVNPRNDSLDSLATYLVHYTEEFLRPAGIACELDIPLILPEVMLASDVRHNLFLATKEALNNAVKHGAPRRVRLGLTVAGGLLSLTVRDDGCGFSPATTAAGADGLGNMRDRLTAIGGELHLISGPGQGTTITMQVSLKPTKPL